MFVHVLFSHWYFTHSWLVSFVHASFLTWLPCLTISFFCLTVTCSPSSPSPTCPCILLVPTLDLSHADTPSLILSHCFLTSVWVPSAGTYSNIHTHTHTQERIRSSNLQAQVSDMQAQMRLRNKHETSMAKGERFALMQDENRLQNTQQVCLFVYVHIPQMCGGVESKHLI